MAKHRVRIQSHKMVTHDVMRITTDRPEGLSFTPGQATEIAINKPGWESEGRPFTFTSLPGDDHLEFTIKSYPSRNGVTKELAGLKANDELILTDVFGAISFRGEGVFVAGGAGVTPFISILRDLRSRNTIGANMLLFANKTESDIINREEFEDLLGENFINILSDEKVKGYAHGFITEEFLRSHVTRFDKNFYLCGPPPMMDAMDNLFSRLKVSDDLIVREEF